MLDHSRRHLSSSNGTLSSRALTHAVHRHGLYLDFEGEGTRSGVTQCPEPHLAGVYRPAVESSVGGAYTVYLFNKSWRPVKNGAAYGAVEANIKEFLWGLIAEATNEDRTIYYWTEHEHSVVRSLGCPRLLAAFEEVSLNVKPVARRKINRKKLPLSDEDPKMLNNYLRALKPNLPAVSSPKIGPAESCRRIDRYCSRLTRWRRWDQRQKDVAAALIEYNREDCLALYRVAKATL